jgi:hypothetical protein
MMPQSRIPKGGAVPGISNHCANPYSDSQLIRNTVHLLLQSGIFLKKEFKDWETTANKTWTWLELSIHGAYQRRLVAVGLRNTSAHRGYAPRQNMYPMLAEGSNSDNDKTTNTQTAAVVTTGCTLGNTYATPVQVTAQVMTSPDPAAAINLLAANQQALLQHMAIMSFHAQPSLQVHTFPTPNTTLFHVLPIQQLTIPGTTNYCQEVSIKDEGAKEQVVVAADRGAVALIARRLLTTWLHAVLASKVVVKHSICFCR